ncbi:MAG: hypothetical protein ACREA2_18515 [Blastocatellia bacterium]
MNQHWSQLHASLERLQADGRTINLFFRDDDVDEDEESLRRLLRFFIERETPVNLAIIPGLLTDEAVRLLADNRIGNPGLLCLNQHGWRHINHESVGQSVGQNVRRKCEFGASRNFAEQFEDIVRGRARLNEAFGSDWFPAFIPPWNRCADVTYRVLDQLGFQALSAMRGGVAVTGYGFREISITLDLYRWKGGARLKPAEEIVDDLMRQSQTMGQTIGIMLHHKVMDESAFSFLGSLLDALAPHSIARFHTFQSLLKYDGTEDAKSA